MEDFARGMHDAFEGGSTGKWSWEFAVILAGIAVFLGALYILSRVFSSDRKLLGTASGRTKKNERRIKFPFRLVCSEDIRCWTCSDEMAKIFLKGGGVPVIRTPLAESLHATLTNISGGGAQILVHSLNTRARNWWVISTPMLEAAGLSRVLCSVRWRNEDVGRGVTRLGLKFMTAAVSVQLKVAGITKRFGDRLDKSAELGRELDERQKRRAAEESLPPPNRIGGVSRKMHDSVQSGNPHNRAFRLEMNDDGVVWRVSAAYDLCEQLGVLGKWPARLLLVQPIDARATEFSATGARICTLLNVAVGRVIAIRFPFLMSAAQIGRVRCHVRRKTRERGLFVYGVQFIGVSREKQTILARELGARLAKVLSRPGRE